MTKITKPNCRQKCAKTVTLSTVSDADNIAESVFLISYNAANDDDKYNLHILSNARDSNRLSLGFWAFIRQMADAYYGRRVHAFNEGLIKQSGSNVAPKFRVVGLDVTLHNLRRTG